MSESLKDLLLYLTPGLFLANLVQSFFYLKAADKEAGSEHMSHKIYYTAFVTFLGAMIFAILSPSLPLMWVAIELTTLVSAPLIAYHRTKESLEAMWKYLLICSIGIGLALFGTMLVMHAQTTGNVQWYKAGFAFILAGYGTKTGLAPFHTWLPDAHSEAPAPVSAMLSGALLNCSLLAIIRFREAMPIMAFEFCDYAMLSLGLLSVIIAAIFMVRQTDYKRLLAYSSVEHMGLATMLFALFMMSRYQGAIDMGGLCGDCHCDGCDILYFAFLAHVTFHSLTKTMLFQTAGNLLLAFKTRTIAAVQGLGTTMKGHAALWIVGTLFICGMPPSVLFLSELGLVLTAPIAMAITILALLFIVFSAMIKVALSMTMGKSVTRSVPIDNQLFIVPFTLLAILIIGGLLAIVGVLA